MLHNVTFAATQELPGEDPKQIRRVALIDALSVEEASANLISSLTHNHPELALSGIVVKAVSKASVSLVVMDPEESDHFFKVRVGFKENPAKPNYKFTYWIMQAKDLHAASAKAKESVDNAAQEGMIYLISATDTLILPDALGDFCN